MAAPLGFKTFVTGDVLTAADTNGYLMQGIWTFATAAARNAAVTAPVEGNTCYLKDTDVIQVYDGAAWVTKSGSSPLTTKGDVYTFSTVDARIGVGANDTVLTADSTAATGLKWSTPFSGSMTQLATGTVSGTSTTLSSISQSYRHLYLVLSSVQLSAATDIAVRPNNDTAANYGFASITTGTGATSGRTTDTLLYFNGGGSPSTPSTANNDTCTILIQNYTTTKAKPIYMSAQGALSKGAGNYSWCNYINNAAVTSLVLCTLAGVATWSVGTYTLYGVN